MNNPKRQYGGKILRKGMEKIERPIELAVPLEEKLKIAAAQTNALKGTKQIQKEKDVNDFLLKKKETGPLVSGISLDNSPIQFL